jgi:hypothetical protein
MCYILQADAHFVCICTAVTTPFFVFWILGQKIFFLILLDFLSRGMLVESEIKGLL